MGIGRQRSERNLYTPCTHPVHYFTHPMHYFTRAGVGPALEGSGARGIFTHPLHTLYTTLHAQEWVPHWKAAEREESLHTLYTPCTLLYTRRSGSRIGRQRSERNLYTPCTHPVH